jgi:cytochrome c biogenesis protein CcmG, thiol:disulfide interchange protein DsbE
MPMHSCDRVFRAACVALLLFAARTTPADSPIQLDQYRGRVVYLDFWASWCAPCQQSFPWMQSLKVEYEGKGLAVVAVNLDRNRADADRFLAETPIDFEVRFDPRGAVAEAYKVKGMPTSVIIDRHGVVRFTHIGFRPIDGPDYEAQLKLLLAEK